MSPAEAHAFLRGCLPQGAEWHYDLEGEVGDFFNVFADALKSLAFDRVDALRLELNPATCTELLPAWEAACGLSETNIARFGSVQQRRNQVVSKLRENGSFSLDDIRAAVQPFLLYANPSQIEILETDRAALLVAHTYPNLTPLPIAPNGSGFSSVTVADDPLVSPAGAKVYVTLSATIEQVAIRLEGPDGTSQLWPRGFLGSGLVGPVQFELWSKKHAGKPIKGQWKLRFETQAAAFTMQSWALVVEGLGRNPDGSEGRGAAMFEWAVVSDPTKVGADFNLEAAQRVINRIKPAHTRGVIVRRGPIDGFCAIPDTDTAIPDRAIPCN